MVKNSERVGEEEGKEKKGQRLDLLSEKIINLIDLQDVWWLMLSGFAVTECLRPAEVTSIKAQTHTSCLRGFYQIRAHY